MNAAMEEEEEGGEDRQEVRQNTDKVNNVERQEKNKKLLRIRSYERRELRQLTVIGQGNFGIVFKAELNGKFVAVKEAIEGQEISLHIEFRKLATTQHCPNIIKLLGVGQVSSIIMELGDFCNLHELLHKYCYIRYTTKHVLGWLIDICNALQFLHGSHTFAIMHGDLKPANVLLFESGNLAKLIDFGSAIKSNLEVQVAGSLSWAPPELLRLNVYTEKSDVYSFGIIAWECFTRQLPVSQTQTLRISTTQLMYEIAKKGHSLDSLPVEFSQINAMTHMCTRFDPSQRPTTDDIHDYLFMLDNKEQSKKFPLVNDLKSECSNVMNLVYSMNIEKDRDMTKIISILVVY